MIIFQENALELVDPEGDVEFKDVHFSYAIEKPILKGVSFKINKGKTLAIVSTFKI